MFQERLKKIPTYFLEMAIAILLVLFFFFIFLWIMNVVFPYGMDLFHLPGSKGRFSDGRLSERMRSDVHVSSKGGDSLLADSGGRAFAKIASLSNRVSSKGAGRIAWTRAMAGMSLFNNDAVQTFDSSRALIAFDDANQLEMGENTLIIIRRIDEDPFLNEKRSLMLIVDGELRGKVAATKDKAVNMEIATPAGIARIHSKEGTKDNVDFKLQVNPDKTATIAVYEGFAEMIAGGKVVKVEENQVATISPAAADNTVAPLPTPPLTYRPVNKKIFYYNELPPRIIFQWKGEKEMDNYHFILASDHEFRNIVVDERVKTMDFSHGNLKDGIYYWKVATLSGWEEGPFSDTKSFTLSRDDTPPLLDVDFPLKAVDKKNYMLTGRTEPGAALFIGSHKVTVDKTGKFSYSLDLKRGINVIVVEAVDKAGNVSFTSKRVKRKE